MRINSNIPALASVGSLIRTNAANAKSSLRLSSGIKINSASDDAAGVAIANKLRNQVNGTNRASLNASNGISIVQTIDGALSEIHSVLQRARELAVQSANDTNGEDDRAKLQLEVEGLLEEVDAMAKKCEYNKQQLLSGGKDKEDLKLHIQIGANKDTNLQIVLPKISVNSLPTQEDNIDIPNLKNDGLSRVDISTLDPQTIMDSSVYPPVTILTTGASKAITVLDESIAAVSTLRARVGAYQNRLEHTISNLDNLSENTSKSLSRIFDTNMASEMTEYTRTNVISQAATSILAQANQRPQMILQLIQ